MDPLNSYQLQADLQPKLRSDGISSVISYCEQELLKLPNLSHQQIIGRSLENLVDVLIQFIDHLHNLVSRDIQVKSMYFEMNEFTGNTDRWYIDLFAYDKYEGTEDLDWLADFEQNHYLDFTIRGLESLQDLFENHSLMDSEGNLAPSLIEEDNAMAYCETLIILRVQQLVETAVLKAKAEGYSWADIPIIITAHDRELTHYLNCNLTT